MEAARRIVINTWSRGSVNATTAGRAPAVGDARLRSCRRPRRLRPGSTGRSTRGNRAMGSPLASIGLVIDGVRLSNAPTPPETESAASIYGTVFFPWPEPVALAAGDLVTVELEARLVAEDYIWSWKTSVLDRGDPSAEKASFTQSTFFGAPLSPAQLRKRAATYTPALNEEGRITRFVLESMDNGVSLGEIAQQVSARVLGALSHSSGRSELRRRSVREVRIAACDSGITCARATPPSFALIVEAACLLGLIRVALPRALVRDAPATLDRCATWPIENTPRDASDHCLGGQGGVATPADRADVPDRGACRRRHATPARLRLGGSPWGEEDGKTTRNSWTVTPGLPAAATSSSETSTTWRATAGVLFPAREDDPHVGAIVPGPALIVAEDRADRKPAASSRDTICGTDRVRKVKREAVHAPGRPAALDVLLIENREAPAPILAHGLDERQRRRGAAPPVQAQLPLVLVPARQSQEPDRSRTAPRGAARGRPISASTADRARA